MITGSVTAISAVTEPVIMERSEEHTSELQSRVDLVCRLLLEKKKKNNDPQHSGCSNNHGSATFIHHNVSPRAFHYYMNNSKCIGIYDCRINCIRDVVTERTNQ